MKKTIVFSIILAFGIMSWWWSTWDKINLPEGYLLRDSQKINNTWPAKQLVLYLEPGWKLVDSQPTDFDTCPGEILGQPLNGKYHLGIWQMGRLVSDLLIPNPYSSPLSLIFKNKTGETVKLLTRETEFVLKTTAGGCGFWDGLVLGYNKTTQKVRIYSDWWSRFEPTNGEFYDKFQCGDHGNMIQQETWYQFDKTLDKYIISKTKNTPC